MVGRALHKIQKAARSGDAGASLPSHPYAVLNPVFFPVHGSAKQRPVTERLSVVTELMPRLVSETVFSQPFEIGCEFQNGLG